MISLTGTLAATGTVLLSTLDDSVWLMPFVASSSSSSLSRQDRFVHGLTFLTTLVGLAVACCVMAVAIQHGVLIVLKFKKPLDNSDTTETDSLDSTLLLEDAEQWLEGIAVVLCWSLALGFCIKKKLKQRRRRQQQQQQQQQQEQKKQLLEESKSEEMPLLLPASSITPSRTSEGQASEQQNVPENSIPSLPGTGQGAEVGTYDSRTPTRRRPCTVASLTALGFLDEISYFPTLILGGILSVWDLILGTLIAGLLMLTIQVFLASQCRPLIECLDRHVPLYGIIAIFATVLTVHWIWDMLENKSM